jgi:hypothetical protein
MFQLLWLRQRPLAQSCLRLILYYTQRDSTDEAITCGTDHRLLFCTWDTGTAHWERYKPCRIGACFISRTDITTEHMNLVQLIFVTPFRLLLVVLRPLSGSMHVRYEAGADLPSNLTWP